VNLSAFAFIVATSGIKSSIDLYQSSIRTATIKLATIVSRASMYRAFCLMEDDMLNRKFLIGLAFVAPLLVTAIPAEAAKKKVDATAARAACFKEANAAVAGLGAAAATPTAEKQSAGYDAYVSCCRKAGIAP
jgi:hypothetical protein